MPTKFSPGKCEPSPSCLVEHYLILYMALSTCAILLFFGELPVSLYMMLCMPSHHVSQYIPSKGFKAHALYIEHATSKRYNDGLRCKIHIHAIPCSKVTMNKLVTRKVLHSFCNVVTYFKQCFTSFLNLKCLNIAKLLLKVPFYTYLFFHAYTNEEQLLFVISDIVQNTSIRHKWHDQ